jgi:hypothetical protein
MVCNAELPWAYYLDSDKLEGYLHFRHDSMQYFYDIYLKNLGAFRGISRFLCKPGRTG